LWQRKKVQEMLREMRCRHSPAHAGQHPASSVCGREGRGLRIREEARRRAQGQRQSQ
jgi:hypothetical protein